MPTKKFLDFPEKKIKCKYHKSFFSAMKSVQKTACWGFLLISLQNEIMANKGIFNFSLFDLKFSIKCKKNIVSDKEVKVQ